MSYKLVLLLCISTFGRKYSNVTASVPRFTKVPTWPEASYYDEDGPQISLDCVVDTDPTVSLLWYRDGQLVHSEPTIVEISNRNQTLALPDPKPRQTGTYRCVAVSSEGNISHAGYIYISHRSEEVRPRIVSTVPDSQIQYSHPGDVVNISCLFDVGGTSTALMDLQLDWNKDGRPLNDTRHHTWNVGTTDSNNQLFSLTLTHLQATDYGHYECVGQNSEGNDSRIIEISPPLPPSGSISKWIYIGVGVGGGCVVVVVAVTIAVVVHRRRLSKLQYDHLDWQEPDADHYEVPNHAPQYDVFVSYSSGDQPWVKDVLFDRLSQNSYSVCIDFKDFTPGMAVSENIVDAVYKSRKTIVVMSSNFLTSMWGQFELQQAHNRAIVQREDVLVLIKYDTCKVPAKLMGKTFLDWTDAGVQPHFWQRLYEAIGEPGNYQYQNEADTQNAANIQNEAGIQNETDIQNEAYIQNQANIQNEAGIQNEANIQNEAGIQNEADIQNEAGIQYEAYIQNEAGIQNEADIQNEAGIQYETNIQNEAGIQNEADIQNEAGIQNEADIQNEAGIQNESVTENESRNCTGNTNSMTERDTTHLKHTVNCSNNDLNWTSEERGKNPEADKNDLRDKEMEHDKYTYDDMWANDNFYQPRGNTLEPLLGNRKNEYSLA